MVEWDPAYEEIEEVRPFAEVAEDRGYTLGENAEGMLVGTYEGDNVFAEPQDSIEASYNILADILGQELSEYDLRVPSASYDGGAKVRDQSSSSGVLITREITPDFGETRDVDFYSGSLIDVFAFQALMGQGDLLDNTSSDFDGFFAYDFGGSGADISGIYNAVKSEAEKMAERNGLGAEIESYDEVGDRAVEMAEEVDLKSLQNKAASSDVESSAYMSVMDNIQTAKDAGKASDSVAEFFSPTSSVQDEGVELL